MSTEYNDACPSNGRATSARVSSCCYEAPSTQPLTKEMDSFWNKKNTIPASTSDFLHQCESHIQSSWSLYVEFAQKNRAKLLLADNVMDRFLWWILPAGASQVPQNGNSLSHSQQQQSFNNHSYNYARSIIWALVSLHRLALDLALRGEQAWGDDGNTVQLPHDTLAFRLRLGVSIIQSLRPLSSHCCHNEQEALRIQQLLERLRFLLRAGLLWRYWKRVQLMEPESVPGLMQVGGMLGCVPSGAPSLHEEQVRRARHTYVGRRTGRQLTAPPTVSTKTTDSSSVFHVFQSAPSESMFTYSPPEKNARNMGRLRLGEILYIVRPLFWAEAQAACVHPKRTKSLWMAWLVSLGMDLTSLVSLQTVQRGNAFTNGEWKRRRMRLLLYLLRSPVWNQLSDPSLQKASSFLSYIPVLGSLVSVYLQDWIVFWKEYHLEDG